MRPLFYFKNITSLGRIDATQRCFDCCNGGWVILDEKDRGYEVAAPCPMCQLGGTLDAEGYWQGTQHAARVSWDGGRSLTHIRCGMAGCGELVQRGATHPCWKPTAPSIGFALKRDRITAADRQLAGTEAAPRSRHTQQERRDAAQRKSVVGPVEVIR